MPMRLDFNKSRVALSPNSRRKFLELSRKRADLMKKYMVIYHELRRRNLDLNARKKLDSNVKAVIDNMEKTRHNLSPYQGAALSKERNAEFNSRINKGSQALAHIASRREVISYYKGALEAAKMLANLQKKWNAKYGPASPGGRRGRSPVHSTPNRNALGRMALNPRGRSPRVKTASPRRSATPKRVRSAPGRLARGVLLYTPTGNNAMRARVMERAGFPIAGEHNAKTWRRSPGGRVHPK
jgi:hypothetical protein